MSQTVSIVRNREDAPDTAPDSPGGLRQYHRLEAVQVGEICIPPEPADDTVMIQGDDGRKTLVTCFGLFDKGVPVAGDLLLLFPEGRTEWVSAAEFEREKWVPVRGPSLS